MNLNQVTETLWTTQLDGMVDVILAVSIQLLAGTILAKAFGVWQ